MIDAVHSNGDTIKGYCEADEKLGNPFGIDYLGLESESLLVNSPWIVAIGDNRLREIIINKYKRISTLQTIVHKSTVLGSKVSIDNGTFISANVVVNSLASIGRGCIINTSAVIEHECTIGDFAHIAPGAVLAGNVSVGKRSFIGANSVVKQGVKIGDDVIIGAGTVVLEDVPDKATLVGNPGRRIN